jgi:hypothetical protein
MTRKEFLKKLGYGALVTPAAVAAIGTAKKKTSDMLPNWKQENGEFVILNTIDKKNNCVCVEIKTHRFSGDRDVVSRLYSYPIIGDLVYVANLGYFSVIGKKDICYPHQIELMPTDFETSLNIPKETLAIVVRNQPREK